MATCAADALITVTASLSLERLLLEAGRSSVSSFLLQAQQTTQALSSHAAVRMVCTAHAEELQAVQVNGRRVLPEFKLLQERFQPDLDEAPGPSAAPHSHACTQHKGIIAESMDCYANIADT